MSTTAYIAAATNRFSQAADISPDSLIAFGSSKFIALWNPQDDNDVGIFQTLPGHDTLVKCIAFVSEAYFISADDRGSLICWRKSGSQWRISSKTQGHSSSVSSICVHNDYVATGGSDALVKIWSISESGDLSEIQTITMGGRYPLSLALTYIPGTRILILAVGGTDSNVRLWLRSDDLFTLSAILSGHEDWIRSIAFKPTFGHDQHLILASGSQDATIRLWNIEPFMRPVPTLSSLENSNTLNDDLLDTFEASLGDVGDAEEGGKQISLKRHILTVRGATGSVLQFSVTFDALLIGHEAAVTSLSWRPSLKESLSTLLSTSTDSSLILWSPSSILSTQNSSTPIWINRQRFGDIGGQRLGGFVGGLWALEGRQALSWGWAGGWRRWQCGDTSKQEENESWMEVGAVSGHSGPVKGLDWSPNGEYLITTGLDQTTRIHGALRTQEGSLRSWHEISRPQVHGYDLLNVTFIDALRFASIADEKVVRVFEAPRAFVELAEAFDIANFTEAEHNRPAGASVPPLGLSNKAIDDEIFQQSTSRTKNPLRPFEGELASSTLWPEIEKVFGHGYESITLDISKSRRMLASACKATTVEHAVVRIYDTQTFRPIGQPLSGHSLTVTRIAFSPDDRFVLTVSRDRSWRLFEMQGNEYTPISSDKSHGRIIWDCAWALEGDIFATASRDKTVKIWSQAEQNHWVATTTIKTSSPATAVAFSAGDKLRSRRLAIGLESGEILIYANTDPHAWTAESAIGSSTAHNDHVHRLSWRPTSNGISELASCSEDGTVRILIVQTTN